MKDRIATVDVGTNTALLLVCEWVNRKLRVLDSEDRFVRLGEGVDQSGVINEMAVLRLLDTLKTFQDRAAKWGVSDVIVGATSASRDAGNSAELIDLVYNHTGLHYEILSGEQEATWSFRGALSSVGVSGNAYLILDIGGGSTEVVVGACPRDVTHSTISYRRSLNIGSVRLMERFFSSQPPDCEAIENARSWVDRQFEKLSLPASEELLLVGASGTTSVLALLEDEASGWDELSEERITITDQKVRSWGSRLLEYSYEEVLNLNPRIMTGRADVFPAGVLILQRFMRRQGFSQCLVSPRGLRHGLALRHWLSAES